MLERWRRGLHREATAEQGRAAPPELLHREAQGHRAVRRREQEDAAAAALRPPRSRRRCVGVGTAGTFHRSRDGPALFEGGAHAVLPAPAQARAAGVRLALPGRSPAQMVIRRPPLALPVMRLSTSNGAVQVLSSFVEWHGLHEMMKETVKNQWQWGLVSHCKDAIPSISPSHGELLPLLETWNHGEAQISCRSTFMDCSRISTSPIGEAFSINVSCFVCCCLVLAKLCEQEAGFCNIAMPSAFFVSFSLFLLE